MCGIAGKLYFTDHAVLRGDIERMIATTAHRGPDDTGVYISPTKIAGLGHNRLAIIDPTPAGRQPMRCLNRYVVTFNGEIYNHANLRAQLETQGYSFSSNTDTEILPALYDKYGVACLQHLNGMFAFAIFDEKQKTLFCARDRLGEKPLKYYHDGKVFMFVSEIKALLTQPDYVRAIDPVAIHHYLTLQYVPAPFTGYRNLKKLEAAHYLVVNAATGAVTKKRYWQPSLVPALSASLHTWANRVHTTLDDAVKMRLMADVPLGAFLSGGLDSSLIVALMQRHRPTPIKTFSIDFADGAHSEAAWAKKVSEHVGTDHTTLTVTPDLLDIIPKLADHLDEPFADSSIIPTYYVSQLARQQVTVALTGDGADEIFGGYRHYLAHRAADFIDHFPGAALAASAWPVTSSRWRRWQESLSLAGGARHAHYVAYLTRADKTNLYTKEYLAHHQLPDTYQLLQKHWPSATRSSIVAAQYVDTLTYLPEDILMKTDAASMSVSLEARAPFLDHTLVELAYSLPPQLKIRGLTQQKYILKYIANTLIPDLLPPGITTRPKHGFTLPLARWLRSDLNDLLTSTLQSPQAKQRQMFRPAAIKSMLTSLQRGDEQARPLWALFMLELWLQKYGD